MSTEQKYKVKRDKSVNHQTDSVKALNGVDSTEFIQRKLLTGLKGLSIHRIIHEKKRHVLSSHTIQCRKERREVDVKTCIYRRYITLYHALVFFEVLSYGTL